MLEIGADVQDVPIQGLFHGIVCSNAGIRAEKAIHYNFVKFCNRSVVRGFQQMSKLSDVPKTLQYEEAKKDKMKRLHLPHIKLLTEFVYEIRRETRLGEGIPYFDPDDGGTDARCMFLLEAPGRKAVNSGFISRNNPDETAKNFFMMNKEAGVPREDTLSWNIVPWYIGDGKKIRSANNRDILDGLPYLYSLLEMLPKLEIIVLVGKKAQLVRNDIERRMPYILLKDMHHPSPKNMNTRPEYRKDVVITLKEIANYLALNGGDRN